MQEIKKVEDGDKMQETKPDIPPNQRSDDANIYLLYLNNVTRQTAIASPYQFY